MEIVLVDLRHIPTWRHMRRRNLSTPAMPLAQLHIAAIEALPGLAAEDVTGGSCMGLAASTKDIAMYLLQKRSQAGALTTPPHVLKALKHLQSQS